MPAGEHDDGCGRRARARADEGAVAELLDHERERAMRAGEPGLRGGDRQRDREDRHADAVVEPALDVEALTHQRGQGRQGHDGLAERGIGRSEDHGEDERFGPGRRTQ